MATFEKQKLQQLDEKGLPEPDGTLQNLDELEKIQLRNEIARLQIENVQLKGENGVAATKTELLEAEVARLNEINAEMNSTMKEQETKISNLEKNQSEAVDKKVMEAKIASLEAQSDEDFKVLDGKKKTNRFMFVEKMQTIARLPFSTISSLTTKKLTSSKPPKKDPNVIKKLFKPKNRLSFLAYLTLDENEKPRKIHFKDVCRISSRYDPDLYINGVRHYSKKFVLDGAVTFYDADPFDGNTGYFNEYYSQNNEDMVFSKLLKYVRSCNISDLFLYKQKITLKDYEKLAKSGTIKNLYFLNVEIKDEDDEGLVKLEEIMENLPNIEKIGYGVIGDSTYISISEVFTVSKGTFKNLIKLPRFDNLKVFKLYNIVFQEFDADGFLAFMKKHPQTQFELSFYCDSKSDMAKREAAKQKLRQRCPFPEKLTIQ